MDSKITSIGLSRHGCLRMEQRGIKPDMVILVLSHGKVIRKQGLRFYFVPKADSKDWKPRDIENVKDLIVITDRLGFEMITCYRNTQAVKAIKKKPKWLCKGKSRGSIRASQPHSLLLNLKQNFKIGKTKRREP